jgi:hypothetical protein
VEKDQKETESKTVMPPKRHSEKKAKSRKGQRSRKAKSHKGQRRQRRPRTAGGTRGQRSVNQPQQGISAGNARSRYRVRILRGGDERIVEGWEYLGSTYFTNTNAGTTVLDPASHPQAIIQINPRLIATKSRLTIEASLYERFVFDPAGTYIEYEPASSTGTGGSIIMGFEPDPKDRFPETAEERIRFMQVHQQNATCSPWVGRKVHIPKLLPNTPMFYVDQGDGASPDVRQCVQCVFRAIVQQPITGTPSGAFRLHYRVKLSQAKLDVESASTLQCGAWLFDMSKVTGLTGGPYAATSSDWPGFNTWPIYPSVTDATHLHLSTTANTVKTKAAYVQLYAYGVGLEAKDASNKAVKFTAGALTGVTDIVLWNGYNVADTIVMTPPTDFATGVVSTTDLSAGFFCKMLNVSSSEPPKLIISLAEMASATSVDALYVFIQEVTIAQYDMARARLGAMVQRLYSLNHELGDLKQMIDTVRPAAPPATPTATTTEKKLDKGDAKREMPGTPTATAERPRLDSNERLFAEARARGAVVSLPHRPPTNAPLVSSATVGRL